MNKDIVLVPCYRRPEFLYHCLSRISKAHGIGDHTVVICEDHHDGAPPSTDNWEVMKMFPGLRCEYRPMQPHPFFGNNWNTLKAYAYAEQQDCELVYLVEEDVMVGEDFFTWHEAVMKSLDPFCSIGVRHLDYPTFPDPSLYLETHSFASLGVCFPKFALGLIRRAIPEGYFENPIPSLDAAFPDSVLFKGHSGAQDGLISRLMERHGLHSICPMRPRAFHAGWYGFNRSMEPQPKGALQENIAFVGAILDSPEALRMWDRDCHPYDLTAPEWNGELKQWKPSSPSPTIPNTGTAER